MKLSVVAIGDELLLGQVVDTNSGDIARIIAPAGWSVNDVQQVHDDAEAIITAIEKALSSTDIVITTGGLGPTKDDITKATLCRVFGGRLVQNNEVLAHVREVFEKRGLHMNKLTETQAMVPDSCVVIANELGTAPIMWFEKQVDGRRKVLVAMPGVPFEMRHAFASAVFPRLLEKFGSDCVLQHRTLIVVDITESDLAERIGSWEDALPTGLHVAYLPNPGYIRLRLDAIGNDADVVSAQLNEAVAWLLSNLGAHVIATDDVSPAQLLVNCLEKRGLTVGTAESCTGGEVAHRLTMLAGVSAVYRGGIVAYSNEVKHNCLGVSNATLEQFGAVSEPVVAEMVQGARRVLGSDCAIATSGIAGPGGGTPEKPIGTVCIAVATPHKQMVTTLHLPGNRARVIDRAATTVLIELVKLLS
jgi:nicotinamide-nucleotide amidase